MRLTVATKLNLITAIAVLGIVLLTVLSTRSLSRVFEAAGYAGVNSLPSVVTLNGAEKDILLQRVRMWRHIASTDAQSLAQLESKIAESHKAVEDSFNEYAKSIANDKDRVFLEADRHAYADFVTLREKILELSKAGKKSEASVMSLDNSATLEKPGNSLTSHAHYNVELANKGNSDAIEIKAGALRNGLILSVSTLLILAALGFAITRQLAAQLGGEPDAVAAIANRVAQGDFSSVIALKSGDTDSVLATMSRMQNDLKNRTGREHAAAAETQRRAERELSVAAENARIRISLDTSSTSLMIADEENTIIYANEASQALFRRRASDMITQIPKFDASKILGSSIDMFHKVPSHQRNLLANLSGSHTANLSVGGARLRVIATPVTDGSGKRLGTSVQWVDRTEEVMVEEEIQHLVQGAVAGDLSVRISESGKTGFFAALAKGMNSLLDSTSELVSTVRTASNEVDTGVLEIAKGNVDLSQRTEEQAASLEQTASSMEQMTAAIRNTADNAAQANSLAAAARAQAEKGGQVVASAVTAMSEINGSSKKIADIIGVIDEIAFQTNLLALNAAVEAARAGEQGRGFAVVASEVRSLAGRSATAAKEIKELIKDSVNKVEMGSKLVDDSGRTLAGIVLGVKQVSDIVAEIAAACAEQASGVEQVNKAVTNMDEVTQQNAALVEQATAAAQALQEQSANLQTMLERYTVGGGTGAVKTTAALASSKRRVGGSRPAALGSVATG